MRGSWPKHPVGRLLLGTLITLAISPFCHAQTPVATEMRNVQYHFTDTIAVDIANVRGHLLAEAGHEFPVFDNAKSFRLSIESAVMAISAESLTHLLNEYTFAGKDAPLKKLAVSISGSAIKVKGVLRDKGIPFETEGAISATPDGKLRLHANKIRAAHLPAKGIMDLFGIEIADLVKTNKVRGLTIDKDDLLLDPQELFPPPAIEGHVSAVALKGIAIVLTFGRPSTDSTLSPGKGIRNYMAYRGGTLRFGKLTMSDTDLTLIDEDQRDPFDFYLGHYLQQLVAGYSKTTPKNGLMVYMPDYGKLKRAPRK